MSAATESHLRRKASRNVFQTEEDEEEIRRRANETTKVFSGETVSVSCAPWTLLSRPGCLQCLMHVPADARTEVQSQQALDLKDPSARAARARSTPLSALLNLPSALQMFSFFLMFRDIIFVSKGSVITVSPQRACDASPLVPPCVSASCVAQAGSASLPAITRGRTRLHVAFISSDLLGAWTVQIRCCPHSFLCTQAIWIELLMTLGISFYAVYDEDESDVCNGVWCFPAEPIGHQIVGTLLAFLVVFRSQIAFNMYMDGRTQFQRYMSASTELCLEILGCLAHEANELHAADGGIDAILSKVNSHQRSVHPGAAQHDAALDNAAAAEWISGAVGADAAAKIRAKMVELDVDAGLLLMLDQQGWKELGVESGVLRAKLVRAAGAQPKMSPASRRKKNVELAFFSQEIVRLTKLCFFCVIEHTRSTCGGKTWKDAHAMVEIFASVAEETEFNRLFGRPENHRKQKQQVVVNGHDEEGQPREHSGPNSQELPSTQLRREVGVSDNNIL